MEPAALTQGIRKAACELGFHLFGVAPAGSSPHFRRYGEWLAAGYNGDMAYLSRRVQQRANPCRIIPEARSIVVLGVN